MARRNKNKFKDIYANSEYSTIEGMLAKVSEPRQFDFPDHMGGSDYVHLGIKTEDGKRIMVSMNTTSMGWYGDINKSKIWYYNETKKREMKTSLKNAERYIGKKFKVIGFLSVLDEKAKKYKINRVQKIVIYI
jgi:hypothetical protein